jgi:hypothetical protein
MPPIDPASVLARKRKPVKSVEVPEWGGTVWLTPMSGVDRFRLFTDTDKENPGLGYAKIVVGTVTDEDGNRLFADAAAATLADQEGYIVHRLSDEAMAVNQMGEHAAKNSGAGANSSSGSGSPAN